MKLAIVHDDFIQNGGAEALVLRILNIYPQATLYTSFVSKRWSTKFKDNGVRIKTSFMQPLPFKERLYKVYAYFGLYPIAFESFVFDEFDVVLSVSARFAHCIITKPGTTHISYINSPPRMFWEFYDYHQDLLSSHGNLFKRLMAALLKLHSTYFRLWDYYASQRSDFIVANSKTPQAKIKKFYQRDSTVIQPFIDLKLYEGIKITKGDFYLIISRLVSWKRIDQAIDACIQTGDRLTIVGTGPELLNYIKRAVNHTNIEVLGYVDDQTKLNLLATCKALIHTQYEDFGIVPLEAMACGKPVIAYGKGGVLETVVEGKTGLFYPKQEVASLVAALQVFNPKDYLMSDCVFQARKFGLDIFIERIQKIINSVYLKD